MCAVKKRQMTKAGASGNSGSRGAEAKGTESEEAFGDLENVQGNFKNNENRKKNQTEHEAGHNGV